MDPWFREGRGVKFWRDVGEAMTEAFRSQLLRDDLTIYYYCDRHLPGCIDYWAGYR